MSLSDSREGYVKLFVSRGWWHGLESRDFVGFKVFGYAYAAPTRK